MSWFSKILGGNERAKIMEVDDDTFQETVLQSELPVVVDFWASWCAPCQVMGGLLRDLVPEFEGRLRIVKLNVDQSPATAGSYGVQSIPTIIIFKKGAIVDEFVGLMQLNPLRQRFERHALPPTKETT